MRSGRSKWQFTAGFAIILTTLTWLGYSGVQESKTYYVTVSELLESPDMHENRLRVAGDVVPGSILRTGGRVQFDLEQEDHQLRIVYVGTDTLPDTLQDRAQAVADGRYLDDGTFHAEMVQAKCASKYEAQAPGAAELSTAIPDSY